MRSSPTLTFSPSDLCFEAGWMVHQHASPKRELIQKSYIQLINWETVTGERIKSPVESSCKPTSKASLSVSERDVVKQLKYCSIK